MVLGKRESLAKSTPRSFHGMVNFLLSLFNSVCLCGSPWSSVTPLFLSATNPIWLQPKTAFG